MSDRPQPDSERPSDFRTPVSLLARVRSRDEQAWEHFHAIYSPLIQYVCRGWGLSGPDVEDVSQEVFKALLSSLGSYRREQDGQVCSFRNWLGGIIRNKILTHLKQKACLPAAGIDLDLYPSREGAVEADGTHDEGEDAAYQEVVRRALGQIRQEFAAHHWQAFWRTAIDGQPAPAVAAKLGLTAAAVRQAKSRVLRRLRDELCEDADEAPAEEP